MRTEPKRVPGGWWILSVFTFVIIAGLLFLVQTGVFRSSCIAEGTAIDTPSGPVRIEELTVGHEVWTLAPSGSREPGRILARHEANAPEVLEIELEDGTLLRATSLHPIATSRGWVEAGQLRAGDAAEGREGVRTIASLHPRAGPVRVYDLEVEPNANFYASGILVHNKSVNWRNAAASLKTLTVAQVDFRSNDRDENGINDFWVGDVAGLYFLKDKQAEPLKLLEISVAQADGDPRPPAGKPSYDGAAPFSSKANYVFRVLRYYEDESGQRILYNEGSGRNASKFGFITHPFQYSSHSSNQWTLIVSEGNTIFRKNLKDKGVTIDTFPRDPLAAGWERMD
jgi:hypothetical protein